MNEQLLNKEYHYIIGVSGGCDSMYLLDTLNRLGYKLYAVHINYHYRHDSDEDYKLVSAYCSKHHIPLYYKECLEEHTGNFQDYARTFRYNYYKEIYDLHECQGLILGHHQDDVLETIYMQLNHHHNPYYLGIREENRVYDMNVIRPMLSITKEYIRIYCKEHSIPYRDDYTNFETDFERDYVRNKVLNEYTDHQKEELLLKALLHNQKITKQSEELIPLLDYYNEYGYIELSKIYHTDLFLYLLLNKYIETRLISSSLIEEIKKQIKSSKPNIEMNLPVNYMFIKEYDNIYIINKQLLSSYSFIFNQYEDFKCPYFTISKQGHLNEGIYLSEEDYPIMIRSYKSGDIIKTKGGTKKVSRLFINKKIPLSLRRTWPILLNKYGEIILVPHLAKNIEYLTTNCNLFVVK